jgi:hypothetical protein
MIAGLRPKGHHKANLKETNIITLSGAVFVAVHSTKVKPDAHGTARLPNVDSAALTRDPVNTWCP